MGNDNYKEWNPIENLPTQLYFFKLHNESGILTILLKCFDVPNMLLSVKFDGILAYQVVQEAGRLKTLNDNAPLNVFNITTNSAYLKWFKDESGGIFDDWSLVHIAICNSDNILDVITNTMPEVKWYYYNG